MKKILTFFIIASLFLVSVSAIQTSITDNNAINSINTPECANDAKLIQRVIEYKDGKITLSELLNCISIWNISHPDIKDKERMSKLVTCISDYKNGEKTFSELLACIQEFNLNDNVQCKVAIDCEEFEHIEIPGNWGCEKNQCVWMPTQETCEEGKFEAKLSRESIGEKTFCIKNRYWTYLNRFLNQFSRR